mgnify:CR=1 FL=1
MVVLAMTERDLPLLQFFSPLLVELQATVTGRTDVVPKNIPMWCSMRIMHAAIDSGGERYSWRGCVLGVAVGAELSEAVSNSGAV